MARGSRTKDTIIQELLWAEGLDNPYESLHRSRRLRRLPKADLERFLDEENQKVRDRITPEMRDIFDAAAGTFYALREPDYRPVSPEDRLWMVKHHLMRYEKPTEVYRFTEYGISVLRSLPERTE